MFPKKKKEKSLYMDLLTSAEADATTAPSRENDIGKIQKIPMQKFKKLKRIKHRPAGLRDKGGT